MSQRRYGMHTDAVVLHCPTALRAASPQIAVQWQRAQAAFFADRGLAAQVSDDPELTVITYNTDSRACLLQRCMDHLGLQVTVLGSDLERWSWIQKVSLVRARLMAGPVADFVVCVDGFDTLMIGDPRRLLARFRTHSADILFAGTASDWPPSPVHSRFEDAVAGDARVRDRHLNASYIGRTSAVLERLTEIERAAAARKPWCLVDGEFDDQLAWREMHRRHHPRLRIDVTRSIFSRFDGGR